MRSAIVVLVIATGAVTSTRTALASGESSGISVRGNQLFRDGARWRPRGVNHSGTEYMCIQDRGFAEGPVDDSLITPMLAWGVDTIRLPLNEDCWLASRRASTAFAGRAYVDAIVSLVTRWNSRGLVVILDLHWSGAGREPADTQREMADRELAPRFWEDVAITFREFPYVMFDLYNEPHDISWDCWRDGCREAGFETSGMQEMVDAVRFMGAEQPILLGGLDYANDLSGWLAHRPSDPRHALVASHHGYSFNECANERCWDDSLARVAEEVPLVVGEVGENDCGGSYLESFLPWADTHGIGYLGWTWNTWDCRSGPALISDYDGTPTLFGSVFRAHLASARGR